jgi:hypothetical protein
MSCLVLNPSVLLATSPDGYLAYDVDSGRLYRLNPTAALIVELCDGTRSREQIFAAVEPLLEANGAAGHLAPGGILGFTVEQGTTFPFRLSDSGRFTHHRDHLIEVAQEAGLYLISQATAVLRYEYGEAVVGLVTVLASPR